jgi:hypothetical protein
LGSTICSSSSSSSSTPLPESEHLYASFYHRPNSRQCFPPPKTLLARLPLATYFDKRKVPFCDVTQYSLKGIVAVFQWSKSHHNPTEAQVISNTLCPRAIHMIDFASKQDFVFFLTSQTTSCELAPSMWNKS